MMMMMLQNRSVYNSVYRSDSTERVTVGSAVRPPSTAHPMELCGSPSHPSLLIAFITVHMVFRDGRRSGVWIWLHLGHGERRGRAGKHRPQQENTARIRMSFSLITLWTTALWYFLFHTNRALWSWTSRLLCALRFILFVFVYETDGR